MRDVLRAEEERLFAKELSLSVEKSPSFLQLSKNEGPRRRAGSSSLAAFRLFGGTFTRATESYGPGSPSSRPRFGSFA